MSSHDPLVPAEKAFFAPIVVDAVMSLDEDLSLDMIGVKKVPGGSLEDSFLVKGVAFKKTVRSTHTMCFSHSSPRKHLTEEHTIASMHHMHRKYCIAQCLQAWFKGHDSG